MKVAEHKLKEPYLYCEVLNGRAIHLTTKVPYHSMSVCGQVVYSLAETAESLPQRNLCLKCLSRTSLVSRKRRG